MLRPRFCALATLLLISAPGFAQQPAWEIKPGGRWEQVNAPTTAPVPDETLDRVEEMLHNNQGTAAKRIVVSWLRANKNHPQRDRGIYLLGQANFVDGDRIMSFYNFDELLDKSPDSRYWYPALERQYDIADAFLKG